jgi:hypothetical protein
MIVTSSSRCLLLLIPDVPLPENSLDLCAGLLLDCVTNRDTQLTRLSLCFPLGAERPVESQATEEQK